MSWAKKRRSKSIFSTSTSTFGLFLQISCLFGQAGSPMWAHASVAVQMPAPHSHVYPAVLSPFVTPYSACAHYILDQTQIVFCNPYIHCTLSSFGANSQMPSAVTSHARNITIRQMLRARRGDTKVHLDTQIRRSKYRSVFRRIQTVSWNKVGCAEQGDTCSVGNNALFPRPTHNTCWSSAPLKLMWT